MKAIYFVFLFLFIFLYSTTIHLAQNVSIDSLETKLQRHTERDSIRVNLLNELALAYHKTDSVTAFTYINEAYSIAELVDYPKGKAKSTYARGLTHAFQSNYKFGFNYFEEAIKLYKNVGSKTGIAACYKDMGIYFYKNGNQEQAITYYKKSLALNEALNDKEEVFIVLNNIGWSYLSTGNYNDAVIYYEKALKSNKETTNTTMLSYCLSDLGVIYTHKGNYPLALEHFNRSLAIGKKNLDSISIGNTLGNMGPVYNHLENYDKAIECYKESIKYLNNTNKNGTASNLNNIGLAYKDLGAYQLAKQYLKDARKTYQEINNRANEALSLNNLGDVYIQTKDFSSAYLYFEQAKEINLDVGNRRGLCNSYLGIATVFLKQKKYKESLRNAIKSKNIADELELKNYQRDIALLLSEIYENTGDYKNALSNHQSYKTLNDSIFNKENIQKIAALESEYKYKEAIDSASIRELKLKQTVTTTSKNLEKSQRNYLWAIIGFLLTTILLGAIIFTQKFKNIKVKNQNIVTEQRLLRSQMTPHFIFNSLSVLQGMILNKEDEKSVSYLSKFSKLLRVILENSRDKMVPLGQELIAVTNYLSLQNLEDNTYQFTISVEKNIDTSLFQIPPMLIQPFVENAIEHAFGNTTHNKQIDVHLKYETANLICTITDNGIGINAKKEHTTKDKNSLATTITAERLKILSKDFKKQGSVLVEDRKLYNEKGTIVTLIIPYIMNKA